ncbi:hypothetical protein [Mycolicibacterium brisbanense]
MQLAPVLLGHKETQLTDIIDRIDELVDQQLADGEPRNGYDFGDPDYPDYPGCPHCHRQWHGLRITKRIESMRWAREFDPEYSYAEDDSPVLCEGSDFIGPRRPPDRPVQVVNSVVAIRIVPDFSGLVEHFARVAERWNGMFHQIAEAFIPMVEMAQGMPQTRDQAPRLGIMRGAPWIIQFDDRNVFSGRIAFDELYGCVKPSPMPVPEGITVEFGPQNWIHEMRRIPPERQFPRPWPRLFSPTELAVRAHWDEFTAPDFPVPERPGYDFTHYAKHDHPTWAPTADTTRARPIQRPTHTTARQRKRGRSQR